MASTMDVLDMEIEELERLALNDPYDERSEMEIRREWEKLEKEYSLGGFNPDKDLEEIEFLVANPGSSLVSKHEDEVKEVSLYVIEEETQSVKEMVRDKQCGDDEVDADLEERCNTPPKKEDLGELLIPVVIDEKPIMALVDTGASSNYMPEALYRTFFFMPKIRPSRIRIKLGDQSFRYPVGDAIDVFVEVVGLGFLADFVITTAPVEPRHPIIIGRTFLNTARAIVDLDRQVTILRRWERVLAFSMREKEEKNQEEHTIHMMGKTIEEVMDWVEVKRLELEEEENEKKFDDINEPEFEKFSFGEINERICVLGEKVEEERREPLNKMIERLTNSKFNKEGESSWVRNEGKRNVYDFGNDHEELQFDEDDDMGRFDDAPSSEDEVGNLTIYRPNGPPLELPMKEALEELVKNSEKLESEAKKDDGKNKREQGSSEVPPSYSVSHANCVDETGSLSLPCIIKNECLIGLVDTGASASVMALVTYKRLKLPRFRKLDIVLELVGDNTTTSVGIVEDVTIRISDFEYKTSFVLVDMVEHSIHKIVIGRPLLRTARALVNLDDDSIMIKSGFRSIMFGPSNSLESLLQELFINVDENNDVSEADRRNDKNVSTSTSTSKQEKPRKRKGKSSFQNKK